MRMEGMGMGSVFTIDTNQKILLNATHGAAVADLIRGSHLSPQKSR
jgi:hypothetical protein